MGSFFALQALTVQINDDFKRTAEDEGDATQGGGSGDSSGDGSSKRLDAERKLRRAAAFNLKALEKQESRDGSLGSDSQSTTSPVSSSLKPGAPVLKGSAIDSGLQGELFKAAAAVDFGARKQVWRQMAVERSGARPWRGPSASLLTSFRMLRETMQTQQAIQAQISSGGIFARDIDMRLPPSSVDFGSVGMRGGMTQKARKLPTLRNISESFTLEEPSSPVSLRSDAVSESITASDVVTAVTAGYRPVNAAIMEQDEVPDQVRSHCCCTYANEAG
jgi:hypothetical protein